MKKSIIIFVITLFYNLTFFAQIEFPFIKEGAVWSQFDTAPWMATIANNKYGMLGDTLVQGLNYKKLYSWQDSSLNIQTVEKKLVGYIREEDGVVDLRRQQLNGISNSYILFDTTWTVGDSIGVGFDDISEEWRIEILNEDSIFIDGIYRTRLHFYGTHLNSGYSTFIFHYIDGLGSTKELLESPTNHFFGPGFLKEITCYHENGFQIYMTPNYSSCYITTVETQNLINDFNFEVFPNPTTSSFFIKNKNVTHQHFNLQLFDFQGIEVFQKETSISQNQNLEVATHHLPAGIYFLKIENQPSSKNHNNTFTIQKIIVSR